MKNFILVLLLAFSLPAFAETVKTAGEAETSAEATLKAIQNHFKQEFPHVKGDAFVDGSMNFSKSSKEYNNYWMMRFVDDLDQPEEYTKAMDAGKKLWNTPFANGKTFASCFPNGGKGAAADYPKVDAATGRVVTFENALNKCLESNGEKPLEYKDMKTMGALSIIARKLSDGSRINIEVKTDAEKAAFARGKTLFYGRFGKAEQACAHCHIQQAGKVARTEELSPVIGHAAHFPVFRPNKATGDLAIISLQVRYEGCQRNTLVADPIKPGSADSNDLEYFHTYLSNGLPLSTGVFRK
jgi:L-cysteine S-thiosulfotransferase